MTTVLVVDKCGITVGVFKEVLLRHGKLDALIAPDSSSAVHMLSANRVDLIVAGNLDAAATKFLGSTYIGDGHEIPIVRLGLGHLHELKTLAETTGRKILQCPSAKRLLMVINTALQQTPAEAGVPA